MINQQKEICLTYEKVNFPLVLHQSTVVGAVINAILAETVRIMADNNFEPPIFLSGNIDGADQHNQQLVVRYNDRIAVLK
ncbi:hypothetical protein [Bacillus sp. FJAT-27986]|uniref:hypothetical protein n=1 Tax=Bacillus sp. FJAT-27986 TaxID=1743146 RepID=UPI00080AD79B|nr:hypothetical protein [Bacillus sp. FJAT-27986]OCA84612.1 hypothetical protein A8L44_09425 [Bacillus sp. FJAT-27986]